MNFLRSSPLSPLAVASALHDFILSCCFFCAAEGPALASFLAAMVQDAEDCQAAWHHRLFQQLQPVRGSVRKGDDHTLLFLSPPGDLLHRGSS